MLGSKLNHVSKRGPGGTNIIKFGPTIRRHQPLRSQIYCRCMCNSMCIQICIYDMYNWYMYIKYEYIKFVCMHYVLCMCLYVWIRPDIPARVLCTMAQIHQVIRHQSNDTDHSLRCDACYHNSIIQSRIIIPRHKSNHVLPDGSQNVKRFPWFLFSDFCNSCFLITLVKVYLCILVCIWIIDNQDGMCVIFDI